MSLLEQYKSHLNRIVDYTSKFLHDNNLSELWIHFGKIDYFFNSDCERDFRANPFAIYVISEPEAVNSWIKINKDGEVTVYQYSDLGFWNVPTIVDLSFYKEAGVKIVDWDGDQDNLLNNIMAKAEDRIIISPDSSLTNLSNTDKVKECILDLEELRLVKTDYEYELLCQAQYLGIIAHRALKKAVKTTNLNEHQLLGLYLQHAKMPYNKQGYSSILAFNRNAAILHYNTLSFEECTDPKSFLVDAGATYKGYQADISRTYCLDDNSFFEDLIIGVGNIKDEIIANMRPGVTTSSLQKLMYSKTAELLIDAEIFKNVDIEKAIELGMVQAFIPHGFGHSMGIGVHDVMGRPKLPRVPGARATHKLEVGNVWTVEPGVYFIDTLLARLQDNPETSKHIDWDLIATVEDHGGIRVEDNVILQDKQLVNFTDSLDNI